MMNTHQEDEDGEEYEEIIEETIIEEREEEVEELIVLRLKHLQGMSLGKSNNTENGNNDDAAAGDDEANGLKHVDEGRVALGNFDTTKPTLTFENGLVLEGKWQDTQGNLAVVGVEKESERMKRQSQREQQKMKMKDVDGKRDSHYHDHDDSPALQQHSSSTSQQHQSQEWAPSLSQRIRSSTQPSQNDSANSKMNDRYVVNGVGTPTRVIVFEPSKEKILERLLQEQ